MAALTAEILLPDRHGHGLEDVAVLSLARSQLRVGPFVLGDDRHNRSQGSQGASGSVGLWRLRNITRPCLFIFQV